MLRALAAPESLSLLEQAIAHAELGQWDEVRPLYARFLAAPDASPRDLCAQAAQRLERGDHTGYQAACAALVTQFSKYSVSVTAEVMRTCTLAPDAVPDLKPAMEWARRMAKAFPKDRMYRGLLGSLLFRADQFAEALSELNEAVKLSSGEALARYGLFQAMVQHRLGKANEARTSLTRATDAGEKLTGPAERQRMELELLRREAELVLREPAPGK